jgi:hypothetical protein
MISENLSDDPSGPCNRSTSHGSPEAGARIRILYLTTPGRLPTVTYDPGAWWDYLADVGHYSLNTYSLNYSWWRILISDVFARLLLEPLSRQGRGFRRLSWTTKGLDLEQRAALAARTLESLKTSEPFASLDTYLAALAPFASFLDTINRAQSEFKVEVDNGPMVSGLDYTDSYALVGYSARASLLQRTVGAAMLDCPCDCKLALFSVTGPEDLLTALIASRLLRRRNPDVHISLIDHGYENFTLASSVERLRTQHTLDQVFDTIVISKNDRDEIVCALADALRSGGAPKGFIGLPDLPISNRQRSRTTSPYLPLPTFSPAPMLWTRLSRRRCYWSRCTFCSQNAKFDSPEAPTHSEIRANLDRIEDYAAAGYRYIMFSDEAISPSSLNLIADEIKRRKIRIHWACRSKLELAHTAELFRKLAESGCFEILIGIETVSPRILAMMDKYTEGLDKEHISSVLWEMNRTGLGMHITLIAGFPGETLSELEQTVSFAVETLSRCRNATFALNDFLLLQDTPIARAPETFGLTWISKPGDIPAPLYFEFRPDLAEERRRLVAALPCLRDNLECALGWSRLGTEPAPRLARELYFFSGHGAVFKTLHNNPFTNPLGWEETGPGHQIGTALLGTIHSSPGQPGQSG